MNENHVEKLLSRYLSDSITNDELKKLRVMLSKVNDDDLSTHLFHLWKNYRIEEEPDQLIIEDIFLQVKRRTNQDALRATLHRLLRYAAILFIPILSVLFGYLYTTRTISSEWLSNPIRMQAGMGNQASLELADGTKVRLNSESVLTYTSDYGRKERSVQLAGEAFFEVKRDTLKPFIVHTRHFDVEVLGTSFNIYSHEEEDISEMTLLTGQIKISTHTNPIRTDYLLPNEKVVFNKVTGTMQKMKTDYRFETAWLRGALVIRSQPMRNVMYKLERKYGVKIVLDDLSIADDLFTGSFDCEQIVDVMEILKTHYNFTYNITGNTVNMYMNKQTTKNKIPM